MKNTVPPFIICIQKSMVILLFFLCISSVFGQIKIGDNPQNIDPSSLLELESTDKAMVLPRITTVQMQAITPLQGAVIYNNEEQCVFYYNGSNWINLCSDANGFSIIDNGDNTYTVNDGINPEFTFSTNTETITNITQNGDGTYTYTNEAGEQTIIATTTTGTSTFSITDNGNNTYTFNDGTIPAFTLSADPETVTNIVQNPNGTFTYTNEAGDETIIANGSGTGSLSIIDNGDNTYTVNDGTNPEFTITATPETVTSIAQNADGTYTYTNEAGDETVIASSALTITDNGDNTYTVNDGTNPAFTITANPETITSIAQNANGTYTYTNEAGDETIITSNALTITDNGDNTYTVNDGTNPEFTITANPETVTSIAQNADGSYTYTNEAGDETIIASSALMITDNGDDTYTVNDGINPEFTITATPETVTSLTENANGTYTYTNEDSVETVISFSGTSEEGSVFFADNANGLAENNAQFFWDNANERLGIGTNTSLTDKLTLNGTMGNSDGSEADPSYRFSADPDTGIYRITDNELGFTAGGISKMKLTEEGLYLNNALPIDPTLTDMPLMIRANESVLFGLQNSSGNLKWVLDLFEQNIPVGIQGGLSLTELGVGLPRLFIENAREPNGPNYGRIGINTNAPQAQLHVVGSIRVTDLPPTGTNESFVTVDESGNFHKSVSAQAAVTGGGRWTNSTTPLGLSSGVSILPIFDVIDYNDGAGEFYEANSNELLIKKDGRYDIRSTIALIGNVRANGAAARTWARISINGVDIGALGVAGNNGSTDPNAYSSINLNDVLNLQANDVLRIKLFSDANDDMLTGIRFIDNSTSNFTIIRL